MNYDELIDRSLDGQLTEAEWNELQAAIIADNALRSKYVEQRWLHAQLSAEADSLPHIFKEESVSNDSKRRPIISYWINAAAAIVVLALGAALLFKKPETPTVATLIEAKDCRWAGSELPTYEGADLPAGTLSLVEGMATIRFHSGATVTLEAPAVLDVKSEMQCHLVEGSVVADVPESAHGFTIKTEKMEVIDLGTKFGVTSSPIGGSHVFVFEGEVKVNQDEVDKPTHILTGKSLHLGSTPTAPDQEISRTEQPTPKEGNWTAITTAVGRGKDAYIRFGDAHGPTGNQPVLMVKKTDLAAPNNRRALLTFDLGSLRTKRVQAGHLTLKMEASGLGFASMVPDSQFAVYGILDPAIDTWRESKLLWENAPEPVVADTFDSKTFVRLAEFEIRKGSPHKLIDISSDELGKFISDHKGTLATLMIVRETGEFDQQGLVHAFASKEHPSGPAPTLWIKTASLK